MLDRLSFKPLGSCEAASFTRREFDFSGEERASVTRFPYIPLRKYWEKAAAIASLVQITANLEQLHSLDCRRQFWSLRQGHGGTTGSRQHPSFAHRGACDC